MVEGVVYVVPKNRGASSRNRESDAVTRELRSVVSQPLEARKAWRAFKTSSRLEARVLSHLMSHRASEGVTRSSRSNLCVRFRCHHFETRGNHHPTCLYVQFRKQTIQLLLLRDIHEVSPESGVSVSRLVSWHFCGLERSSVALRCDWPQHVCKTKSRTFIVHTRAAIR